MIFSNCDYVLKSNLFELNSIYFTKMSENEISPISFGFFDLNRYFYTTRNYKQIKDIYIWKNNLTGEIKLNNSIYLNVFYDTNDRFKNNVLSFFEYTNNLIKIDSVSKIFICNTFYQEYSANSEFRSKFYQDDYLKFYVPMCQYSKKIRNFYSKLYGYKPHLYEKSDIYFLNKSSQFIKLKDRVDNKFYRHNPSLSDIMDRI